MSAVVVQDLAPAIEAAGQAAAAAAEVEWAACACCGLREECTAAYAAGVRARYAGRWLCGLCCDAVGEDLAACVAGGGSAVTSVEVEEAIARHAAFCRALFCLCNRKMRRSIITQVNFCLGKKMNSSIAPLIMLRKAVLPWIGSQRAIIATIVVRLMLIPGLPNGWMEPWRSVDGVNINCGDLKIIDPKSIKLVSETWNLSLSLRTCN